LTEEKMDVPKVGDKIHVPSVAFLTHGQDDFRGGLATVVAIHSTESGDTEIRVEVKERPGVHYAWSALAPQQSELKARCGDQLAHPDPDPRPQFNEGWPREPKK
jgi:hypothetical protein